MNEDVISGFVILDKTITFGFIEKFNCAFLLLYYLKLKNYIIIDYDKGNETKMKGVNLKPNVVGSCNNLNEWKRI